MERLILGDNVSYTRDSQITGLNNNIVIMGTSGSGKTVSFGEPLLLEACEDSYVVSITKSRIKNMYAPVLREKGYDVWDLDFTNPGKGNVCYDCLRYVKSPEDITFLSRSIVMANPQKENTTADPYWDDSSVSLLNAEIGLVLMNIPNATFADVLRIHQSLTFRESGGQVATSLDEAFDRLEDKRPNCFAVTCWRSFKQLPIRTAGCVFGTLNTALDAIFTPALRRAIAKGRSVDFERLANRKTVLFITTSAVNMAQHAYANMFYAQAFKSLFEYAEGRPDGRLPIPVDVYCDDFATGSRIHNFPEYISIFREKGISVMLLLQSESQLERMYGPCDATTIINNCDTYVYLGGMDLKTCRSISERLNVPLNEVLYMPIGQVMIFRRGQQPVVTWRYRTLEDSRRVKIAARYEDEIARASR